MGSIPVGGTTCYTLKSWEFGRIWQKAVKFSFLTTAKSERYGTRTLDPLPINRQCESIAPPSQPFYNFKKNSAGGRWPSALAVVTPEGLEPSTHWLRVSCSTNWATESGAKSRGGVALRRFVPLLLCKGRIFFLIGKIFGEIYFLR